MGRTAPERQQHFMQLAMAHAEDFKTRVAQHDRDNTFPFENVEALKAPGYTAIRGKPNERDTRGNKDYASLTVEKRCQAFSGVTVGRVAMPTPRLVLAVEHDTCQILALHSSPAWRRASR